MSINDPVSMNPARCALHLLAVVLAALPGSALAGTAGADPADPAKYSCFSLTPLRNGNIGPLPAAVLAAVLLLLVIITTVRKTKASFFERILTYLAFLCSILPLYLGSMTPIGWGITCILAVSIVLSESPAARKKRRELNLRGKRRNVSRRRRP